jgi:ribosome biogenesis GTPase
VTTLTREALGWTSWFAGQSVCDASESVARVAAVDRDHLLLLNESGAFRARLAGKFLYEAVRAADMPCVGDWVCVARSPADDFGLVHGVLARRTSLRRRAAGASGDVQMIAANVDVVIVVQSCDYDFNLNRLERYLVMARDGGAEPCVLLTKTDLVEPTVVAGQMAQLMNAGIDVPVLTLSNVTLDGMDELRGALEPGETYCFVGSSGVGKSTLINGLIGRDALKTNDVSGTGEGRHTTVRRELMVLENGAMVIDNPGMREFGVFGAGDGLAASFADISALAATCHFRDCTHVSEPGCAVLLALEARDIEAEHYENFLKLRKESEFYELSAVERRKKDRDFGRFIKSAKKDLRDD